MTDVLRLMLLTVALATAGCSTMARIDRNATSSFTPYPDGTFRFRSEVSLGYPDNQIGEQARMTQLRSWLDGDGMCKDGFDIVSRRVVPAYGLVSEAIYQGRCKR